MSPWPSFHAISVIYLSQPLNECRRRVEPVAAVDQQPEVRCRTDGPAGLEQTLVLGTRVVGREREDAAGASRSRLPCEVGADAWR